MHNSPSGCPLWGLVREPDEAQDVLQDALATLWRRWDRLQKHPAASLVVNGAWGQDSAARWSRLISWAGEQGYIAVGPPTEVWSGDETHPDTRVTEMGIPVVAGRQ